MFRSKKLVYVVAGVIVACGQSDDGAYNTQKSSDADALSKDTVVLKQQSSVESTVVGGQASSDSPVTGSSAFSLTVPEISLNQGGTVDVDVSVQGSTPSGSVTLTAPTLPGVSVQLLNSAGSVLSAPLVLDAQAKATFKLRVSSTITRDATKVVAPGAMNASLQLRAAKSEGGELQGSVPVKVSNVAMFVMSGVTNVRELPATFEFPAGTIPVFMNPPTTAVVGVMHFGGGTFRHQSTGGNMPANNGYCPLNNSTTALVQPTGAVNTACLPCPADATADMTGNFYNHNTENSTQSRTIICKRKI